RGYAEGLADGAFDVQEAADTIAQEAGRLERLVRDLLDLARMNRTDFSFHSEPIDLAVAARETVRRYETQAQSFGVGLEAVAPDPGRVTRFVVRLPVPDSASPVLPAPYVARIPG